MKIITKFLLLAIFLITFSAQAQKFKTPVDYLNFVGKELNTITKNNWKYTKAIAHSKSAKTIKGKRNVLVKSVQKALLKLQRAEGYDGDEFKNQVLALMRLNENMLNQDYAKIIDMKEVAEQSYDLMEAYLLARELADKKMTEAQELYEQQFQAFADKYNVNIIENESDLSKNMKLSNEVFKIYNDMYLLNFKVRINEIYLWDAISKQDVSAIQQNANALKTSAIEGLTLLKTAPIYKNDKSLIENTKETFEFYIEEVDKYIPQIVDFYVLSEDVKSLQETIEKTPQKKRTKEQVDGFNKKVKEVNKAISNYNKVNKTLNAKRQKIVEQLNATNSKFLSKHIPND
ncbi:hypothetical protein [Lacinutrix salivirga]